MNLGKFVGSATVSAIKEWNPFDPEAITHRAQNKAFRKTRRSAKRKSRKGEPLTPEEEQILMSEKVILTTQTGETIEHTPPAIPLRTATKASAGTVLLGYPMIEVVQAIQGAQIPIEWLESFTNSTMFEWLCYSLVPIIIARFTKSPLGKQAL